MMRKSVFILFTSLLMIALLLLPSLAMSETAFPSVENLRQRNVSLHMKGFAFASGLSPDQNGEPNGDGFELVGVEWAGSGFIVRSDGTVVTNYHVAQRALAATAQFDDGATYEIRHIKVYDPDHDLAVLKMLSDKTFPAVALGNSDTVQIQNKVIAVGNTLDMGFSVTEGTINQIIKNEEGVRLMIRHSAPIAPGNSGGALYCGNEVVGVNVATRPPYEIHYAVPINLVKPLLANKYNRLLRWEDVFPIHDIGNGNYRLDPSVYTEKTKQIKAWTGRVNPHSADAPGVWSIETELYQLADYLILVEGEKGTDLDLAILNSASKIIGYGELRNSDIDGVLLSTEGPEPVLISVLNYHNIPVNFSVHLYEIVW